MVNFGSVFSGFSLHHLFMHMNLFWPPFGTAGFQSAPNDVLRAPAVLLASMGWVACQVEGL